MRQDRIFDILLTPVVSEKAVRLTQLSQRYAFKVSMDARKKEIKAAVEKLFGVNVTAVSTVVVKGKKKVFRRRAGRRSDWKKAYVRLAQGQTIEYDDARSS